MEIGRIFARFGVDLSDFRKGMQEAKTSLQAMNTEMKRAFSDAGVTDYAERLSGLRLQVRTLGNEFKALALSNASTVELTQKLNQQIEAQRRVVELATQKWQESVQTKGEMAKATLLLQSRLSAEQKVLASLENQLKNINNETKQTNSAFARLGDIVKSTLAFTAVYDGLHMVSEGIKDVISSGIEFDAQMQQAQIGFATMLGSAQKAQEMLKQLADFAQSTPFDLTGVEDAAKQMLAMGFTAQEILPDMKAIGDAAAALGLQTDGIQRVALALGQMLTSGVVHTEEMNQLVDNNIDAWNILAQAVGKSVPEVRKLVENGLVPAKEATDAIIAGLEQRYPNMLQKMNSSFVSQMGNLRDSFKRTFGDLMKPTFDWLTNSVLPAINDKLNAFRQTLEQTGSASQAFKTIIPPVLVDTINAVAGAIRSLFNFIRQNAPIIASLLAGVAAGFAAANIAGIASAATAAITGLRNALIAARTAAIAFSASIAANPIAAAIGAIVAAAGLLYEAWTRDWFGIQEKTKAVTEVIVVLFQGMVARIEEAYFGLRATILGIVESILSFVSPVVNLVGRIAPGFKQGFENVQKAIDNARKDSLDKFQVSMQKNIDAAVKLASAAQDVGKAFSTWSTPSPSSSTSGAQKPVTAPKISAPTVKVPPVDTLATDKALRDAIKKATDGAQKEASKSASKLKKSGQDVVQAFIDGIDSKLAPLQGKIQELQAQLQFRQDQGNTAAVKAVTSQLVQAYQQELRQIQDAISRVNAEMARVKPGTQQYEELRQKAADLTAQFWQARDAQAQLNNELNSEKLQQAQQKFQAFIDGIDARLKPLQNSIDLLKSKLQLFQDAGNTTGVQKETAAIVSGYQQEIATIEDSISRLQAKLATLNPKTQAGQVQQVKDKIAELNQELYQTRDALQQIQNQAWQQAADTFKSIADKQLDAINTALQNELSAIQKAHQQALDAFDAETKQLEDEIDAQIAALQQAQTESDRSSQEQQWSQQMTDLQHQLAVAQMMGDSRTIKQVQDQIDQLNQEISKQRADWARQDQIQALQQQKQQLDAQRAQLRQALDQEWQDREAAFQLQMQQEQTHFQALQAALVQALQTGKLTLDQANAAWLKAVKDTGDKQLLLQIQAQQESEKALNKWVDKYLDIGRSYGSSLAQGILDGLNSALSAVQQAAARLASAASSALSAGSAAVGAVAGAIQVRPVAFAAGGILTRPTLALAGEAGPEAILPLNDSTLGRLAAAIVAQMGGARGGQQPINVYIGNELVASYVWDYGLQRTIERQRKG